MISFEHVTKKYPDGTLALKDLNLKIGQGEFISVIGPSGAGKSTFLRLINGMIPPSSGTVQTLEHQLSANLKGRKAHQTLREVRRATGFVFQQFNLIKTHTALSNVLTGRLGYMNTFEGVFGMYSTEDRETAKRILNEVGLGDKIDKRVDQLSGGQQQRVAIARAILQEPKIILADEPMASLDPKLSEVVLDLLHKFNQERNITVIVNVHVLDLAKKHATRIIGLNKGQLVFDGTPAQLTAEKVGMVYGD